MEEAAPASGELLGEEEAAEEPAAPEHSVVLVHVKQRCIAVSCGGGGQTVGWLANVGVVRHDASLGRALGPAAGVRLGSGQMVPLHFTLAEAGIRDGQHVWVVLKGQGGAEA
ncbi:hypothetical protein AB1Y20_004198 [Prymnesium parvum]|uniref:Uncharacterized protein n=1 Tax=Prymnesium parvum TaxID=97485 RepID=A0AB34J6R5_PRYPA